MLTIISRKLNQDLYQIQLMDDHNKVVSEKMVKASLRAETIKNISNEFYVSDIKHLDDSKQRDSDDAIPTIPFTNEFDLNVYFEKKHEFIFNRILVAIAEGIKNKKKKIKLFRFEDTNVYVQSSKKSWIDGLLVVKKYLLKYELYEKVDKCQKLIEKLNTFK